MLMDIIYNIFQETRYEYNDAILYLNLFHILRPASYRKNRLTAHKRNIEILRVQNFRNLERSLYSHCILQKQIGSP